jgi:nucleoside-diphosphate-sugar epimerase
MELAPHRRRLHEVFAAETTEPTFRLAISGATGWLGNVLACLASECGLTTANGRLRLFASSERRVDLTGELNARVESLHDAPALTGRGWRLAHLGGLGAERQEDHTPEMFVAVSDQILQSTLRLLEEADAPRMIFTSSGAIYGAKGRPVQSVEESPYGFTKARHEAALAEICTQRGWPLVISRVFSVGGPQANKLDRYAISTLLRDAAVRDEIVLKAQTPVFRSFVHAEELMVMLVHMVERAEAGASTPFDTSGREILELADLARVACSIMGRPNLPLRRTLNSKLAEHWYVGDGRVYQANLARAGLGCIGVSDILCDARDDLRRRGLLAL